MRVERSRDLKQRCQFVIGSCAIEVPIAKVLHGASPIDAGHQAIKPETRLTHYFRRTDVEGVVDDVAWPDPVDILQQENAAQHGNHKTHSGHPSGALLRTHFRFLRSKMSTAPLKAIAV